jgi:hypothetical protein
MSEEAKQPLSIEQALNFLKAKEKDIPGDVAKDIAKSSISVADPREMRQYLLSIIPLLQTVSPEVERAFLTITGTVSASLTKREIARIFRLVLSLRVYSMGYTHIATYLKERMETIIALEELAKIAMQEELHRHKLTDKPMAN